MAKQLKKWQGWLLFLGSMVIVFLLGLLVSSLMERRAEVEQYIKEGRITCGPWYNLPDLYPLDGECLVRNLLKGYRVAEQFGKVMKIA